MNLKEALCMGEQRLNEAQIADARIDAWLLLEWVTGISRANYFMDPCKELSEKESEAYVQAVEKRCQRIPLQHITGEQEFMGFPFHVNEHVLIPRQDTECLVETALEKYEPDMRVLDMCTGSGCIIISVEKLCKNGDFTGCDISEKALAVAKKNAKRLSAHTELIQSDLFENVNGRFDMILSNPPYIRTAVIDELEEEVRCHDPRIALDGREDGLYFYRRIIDEARDHLVNGGWLLFEIGHDQREDVKALMKEAGYQEITARKDLAGLDRVVFGRYYILDDSVSK